MIQLTNPFQDQMFTNDHLELQFAKTSLNTTCTSKNLGLQQDQANNLKESDQKIVIKLNQILSNQQITKPTKKQQGLNKKSKCFMKQISKVLKKNKMKNPSKTLQNNQQPSQRSGFKFGDQTNTIQFKTKVSSKCSKTNDQIKKLITTKDKHKKENFNFEEFLQHMIHTKQNENIVQVKKTQDNKDFKKKNYKKNRNFYLFEPKSSQRIQFIQPINKQLYHHENFTIKQNAVTNINENILRNQQIHLSQFLQDSQSQFYQDQSKLQIETVKSSRMMSMKQSRRIQTQKKNNLQISKLQRSLKKAMTNISFKSQRFEFCSPKSVKTQTPVSTLEEIIQKPLNYAQNMQNIHFDQLKTKVMSKMQDYKKIKQIRDNQQKQKKKFKKKRTFSLQPKVTLTIQGVNLTLNKNQIQANNYKDKQFKHRRPYTALSRTGLQYDRRESYRRRSSDKQHKLNNLAGINNSANHFRTFSKNAARQVEQLDECKSDRVVRKLREKYTSRPQTARTRNMSARSPTLNQRKSERNSQISSPKMYQRMQFGKVTKKQIQKQKIKQKLLGLLVQCQEQKVYNENLKQGLNIFEDYCDNIDQGLKTITQQIDQYIKNEQ